jgi:CBS domain-containing protein
MKNMSKDLIIVDINTKVDQISKIMKNYDIGFVPVSKDNKIVGVLTDRDIVVRILANNDSKIEGYLSSPISIDVNKSLVDALKLMKDKKIKRLLVSDNNKLVGIISLSDILATDINILSALKEIFEINKNSDTYITKINEFYL